MIQKISSVVKCHMIYFDKIQNTIKISEMTWNRIVRTTFVFPDRVDNKNALIKKNKKLTGKSFPAK